MPTPLVPQGTRIYIESLRGAAQAITGITKADPPVITYAGTDPVNGNYCILRNMIGMTQLEDAVVKVANVNGAANTFEAKDQDSTSFSTFVSGNLHTVEFGSELTIATGFSTSGGEPQYANYMLLWDDIERRKFTHVSAVGLDLPVLFDPSDPNYQMLYNLARTDATLAVKFLFKNGVEMLTFGNFGGSGMPSAGDSRSIMTANFSINPTSKPFYVLP
jgi:hypothetical protein